uniref:HTH psq-type domain-containing protein n=1 Tax=Amphimedon queenslandica TaxID=400682 RepID=A0A1X7VB76_AMPQE
MAAAVSSVVKDNKGLRETACLYNIPIETLRRRVNGSVALDCKPGPTTVLTNEEDQLAEYLIKMSEMGFRLTRDGVMGMAFKIVTELFVQIKIQSVTSLPMQIYNCDETGVTIVFKQGIVVAEMRSRSVYAVFAAEKECTHTILSFVSASGISLPLMMTYPCKRPVPPLQREGAVPNTLFVTSDSGWITSELFVEWSKFFLQNIPPI